MTITYPRCEWDGRRKPLPSYRFCSDKCRAAFKRWQRSN